MGQNITEQHLDVLKLYNKVNKILGNISLMDFTVDYMYKANIAKNFFQAYVSNEVLNKLAYITVEMYCLTDNYQLTDNLESSSMEFVKFLEEKFKELMIISETFEKGTNKARH